MQDKWSFPCKNVQVLQGYSCKIPDTLVRFFTGQVHVLYSYQTNQILYFLEKVYVRQAILLAIKIMVIDSWFEFIAFVGRVASQLQILIIIYYYSPVSLQPGHSGLIYSYPQMGKSQDYNEGQLIPFDLEIIPLYDREFDFYIVLTQWNFHQEFDSNRYRSIRHTTGMVCQFITKTHTIYYMYCSRKLYQMYYLKHCRQFV